MNKAFKLAAFFRSLVGKFALSNRGNVALIFAITLVPMLAATGMVVDYTRAALAKQQLQDALDSTALFLSKNASVSTMTSAQLLTTAQTYFNTNFTNTDVGTTTIVPSYTSTGPSVTVTGTTTSPCLFMGIVGVRSIPVGGTSTAVWGHQRLRVALVLDNTGSMSSSGKLTALKTATANLLTQLQGAASTNGDVYVSIIPFVKDVNIGSSNYNQSYIAWDDSSCDSTSTTCDGWWDGSNGSCNMGGGWGGATNSPRSFCLGLGTCSISTYDNNKSGCLTAGTCSLSSYTTQSTCTAAGTCSLSSYTSSASCTGAHACYVSGTYNATYTTSATCTAVGTCSLSSYTTQATCLAAGTCNITSKTTSSTCTGTSACFVSGVYTATYTTSSTCTAAGVCTITSQTTKTNCQNTSGCFISGVYTSGTNYNTSTKCANKGGTWKAGVWTADTWAAGTWTSTPGTWTQTGSWNAGAWTPASWTAATWTNAVWTPTTHSASNWNGCITERGGSPFSARGSSVVDAGPGTSAGNDQLTTTPTTSNVSTLFPAEQYSACPQAMTGLSYNWTSLNTLVTNMVANGSTNQPIGLVWGWQSLVGGGPMTVPAYDSAYQYKLVIILLSDGLNTADRWYGDGSATSTAVDQRMYYSSGGTVSGTCKNIKDQGIIMYTVQVNTGGDPTSTLLQNCASDSSKFFLLTSASAIITTFQSIGTALSDLRLSN